MKKQSRHNRLEFYDLDDSDSFEGYQRLAEAIISLAISDYRRKPSYFDDIRDWKYTKEFLRSEAFNFWCLFNDDSPEKRRLEVRLVCKELIE